MITKEKLKSLVSLIKDKTGLSQEQISTKAGYEKKTLTQRISNGSNLQAIYDQLNLVFGDKLKISTRKTSFRIVLEGDSDKKMFLDMVKKMEKLEANSDEINLFSKAILTSQIGYGQAIGDTLDRMNKVPEGTTGASAGTIEERIWKMLEQKGISAIIRK